MKTNRKYNEKELLLRIAEGDERAFQLLFSQHWRKIYSISLLYAKVPEVAEDATQEVFIQIWNKRSTLNEVDALESYLYTIAKHIVFNMMRKRIFSGDADDYLKEYFADDSASPVDKLELKELSKVLEAGISKLTPQQQKVFRLSRIQKLTHAEIAEKMGLSRRTVKNYMISALLSLRNHLKNQSELPLSGLFLLLTWLNK